MPEGAIFEGKTLDDAVRKGLEALGLSRAEVMITTIEEGSGGFLGLGARPYRVRVMPRPGGAIRDIGDDDRRPRSGARRGERSGGGGRGGRGGPRGETSGRDRGGRGGEGRGPRRDDRGGRRGPSERGPAPDRERGPRPAPAGDRPALAAEPGMREGARPGGREGGRDAGRRRRGGRGRNGRRDDFAPREPRAGGSREPQGEPQFESRGEEVRSEPRGEERGYESRGGGRGEYRGNSDRGGRSREPREPRERRERDTPSGPTWPPDKLAAEGKRFTEELLKAMGFPATVTSKAEEDRVDVTATITADEELITGRKGEVRQALQHVLNLMLNRGQDARHHLQLDINDFWVRREKELADLARELAEEALREGNEAVTEYLNAQERRIVHVTLREDTRVKTYALGTGLIKRVAVAPADFDAGPEPEE